MNRRTVSATWPVPTGWVRSAVTSDPSASASHAASRSAAPVTGRTLDIGAKRTAPHASRNTWAMLLRTAAALVALGLATLSCSDDDEPSASSALTTGATVTPPSGTGCPELPALAGAPAPDAIARLPELSTFADALTTTQYADVLCADGPFTVFAAVDAAFASVADRDALLADDERLTGVLAMHVIDEQRLSAADLATAGTVQALGGDLSFTDEGGELRINEVASVVCADLQTANATVHLLDAVLFPPVA